MDIEIFKMTEDELSSLAEIEKECFSLPWSEASFREELDRDGSFFLVARLDGEIAGYVGLQFVLDEGYITNVAVRRELRRRGVGKCLMESIIKIARDMPLSFVSLEVRESNFGAIALYEGLGFKTMGVRKDFYEKPRENGLIMTLFL